MNCFQRPLTVWQIRIRVDVAELSAKNSKTTEHETSVNDRSGQDLAQILGDIAESEACDARERIINSAVFRSAPQLASFLNYVVKTTLLGRRHEIKGYTIAVEALGRPDDFDPVADPIVRVEAGRLRRAIGAYYAGEGADDPVRISVARGSYVPQFERFALPVEAASAIQLSHAAEVVTAPFANPSWPLDLAPALDSAAQLATPTQPAAAPLTKVVAAPPPSRVKFAAMAAVALLAAGLAGYALRRDGIPPTLEALSDGVLLTSVGRRQPTIEVVSARNSDAEIDTALRFYDEQLSDALSRFDDFTVLKTSSGMPGGAILRPTYRIEFSAQPNSAGDIITALRLFDVANGRVVFAGTSEFPRSALKDLDQIKEIARLNAVRIAQPYGRIYSDLRASGAGGAPVQCVVKTYDYWSSPSAERHAEVRDCLEVIVKADANYHPAWAMLAMIHLDEYRIGYNPKPGSALDRARKAAQQAVMLAPESARALQGLMAVLTVSGETEEALKVGFEAVRRNPFDTDILADLGARLTQAGRARDGRPLLLRAAEVNRARPVWHEFYLYLSARQVGDKEGARLSLKTLELTEAPLALLAQAIGASDRGSKVDAMVAMRKLSNMSPVFGDDAGEFLDRAFLPLMFFCP